MTFEEALVCLKQGQNVGRPYQESMWLKIEKVLAADDELFLSVEDILAKDWTVNFEQFPEGPPMDVVEALGYPTPPPKLPFLIARAQVPARTWEIWCEGYRATGEHGTAQMMGRAQGKTFQEACDAFFAQRNDASFYDAKTLRYWACGLYDNEARARKNYG